MNNSSDSRTPWRLWNFVWENSCLWLLLAILAVPLVELVGTWSGRRLILYLAEWTHEIRAAAVVLLTAAVFCSYRRINALGRLCAYLCPIAAAVCGIFSATVHADTPLDTVCVFVEWIASICVFLHCTKNSALKAVMVVLDVIISLPFVILVGLLALLLASSEPMAETGTSEKVLSPDGTQSAQLGYVDEGALGWSQYLLVDESGEGINVLIGRLKKSRRIDLEGQYAYSVYDFQKEEFISLEWQSNAVLLVDGVPIIVDPQRGTQASVVITVQCDGVYGLGLNYYLQETLIGTQVCTSDPQMSSPLKRGADAYFTFYETDFPVNSLPMDNPFRIRLTVLLEGGSEKSLPIQTQWLTAEENTYRFILTGDAENGFSLTPVDSSAQ